MTGLNRLPSADVVIVGEVHDNPAHHANQARAVASIRPAALVFEMLTPDKAALVPPLRDDPVALAKALDWEESGWPDFAMYYPIFTAAPDAAIFGGDLPVKAVRQAIGDGAAKPFGADAARYGLDRPLARDDQTAREAEQAAAHCGALPPDMLPGMVAAQRLRDAALARAVVQAFDQTGGPVVLITGSGHARRDVGVPAVLALAAPDLTVLSVGQLEGPAEAAPPFDLWLVTDATERGDPCAAFAKPAP